MKINIDLNKGYSGKELFTLINAQPEDLKGYSKFGEVMGQTAPSLYLLNSPSISSDNNFVIPGAMLAVMSFTNHVLFCIETFSNPFIEGYDVEKNIFYPLLIVDRTWITDYTRSADEQIITLRGKVSLEIYRNTMKVNPAAGLIGQAVKGIAKASSAMENDTMMKNGKVFNLNFIKDNQLLSLKIACEEFYEKDFDLLLQKQWIPTIPVQDLQAKKEGCFIATACYGDYNHNNVKFLRWYRDAHLRKTPFGVVFINTYYFLSPPLARLISKSAFFQTIFQWILVKPLIKLIQFIYKV